MESPKKLLPVNASEIIDQVKCTIFLRIYIDCHLFIFYKIKDTSEFAFELFEKSSVFQFQTLSQVKAISLN